MAKKKKTSFISLMLALIMLALCIGSILILSKYTNGFTGEFNVFNVRLNGTKIDNKSDIVCNVGDTLQFDVSYVFSGDIPEVENMFYFKIYPNNECEMTVGEEIYSYYRLEDITDCFDIKYEKMSVSFLVHSNRIEDIAAKKIDSEINIKNEVNTYNDSYIGIEICSYNKKIKYNYNLKIYQEIEKIEIPEGGIIFG